MSRIFQPNSTSICVPLKKKKEHIEWVQSHWLNNEYSPKKIIINII